MASSAPAGGQLSVSRQLLFAQFASHARRQFKLHFRTG